jgi:hypothetical protein
MKELDNTEYFKILDDYRNLNDTAIVLAFSIMKRATDLEGYYSELVHDYTEILGNLEVDQSALKARLSIDANQKDATNGNRYAVKDTEYIDLSYKVNQAKKVVGHFAMQEKKLHSIAFQCYSVWDNANRKTSRW